MKKASVLAIVAVVLGVFVALVWAQQYDSLIDYIAENKVNDQTKAWAMVVRDVCRLADSYTTLTDTQKKNAMLKISEAVCSGTTPANIGGLLTPVERESAVVVWKTLIAEWKAVDQALQSMDEAKFKAEW
jgi:hypothetical protein